MIASSLLLSLALLPHAEAANVPKIKTVRIRQVGEGNNYSLTVVTPDADAQVASVAGELDGETVRFAETDAWSHGTATLSAAALADGATMTLTVYDDASAVLGTYSGTYSEGALTLTSLAGDASDGCTSRVGCESSTTETDLEVLGALVYADGTVGIDLAGADALSVASASLTSIVRDETGECVVRSRTGECVEYAATTTRETAELDLDEVGVAWESGAVSLEGAAELQVKAYDALGEKLDKAKLDVGPAWDDGGAGQSALIVDEDPFTTCSLISDQLHNAGTAGFVVVSDGWTLGDTVPDLAEVALEGGETWSIPVNSYQRTGGEVALLDGVSVEAALARGGTLALSPTDLYFGQVRLTAVGQTVCGDGLCAVLLGSDAEGYELVTTHYAGDSDDLVDALGFTLAVEDADGIELRTEDVEVSYSDEVTAVFAIEAELTTDAQGLDLIGKVKLQGPANQKGKRSTLAKGKFVGQFHAEQGFAGVDCSGECSEHSMRLAPTDKDGSTVSRGDILIGGEPIDIERTGAPPAFMTANNGKGTRNVATTNNGKPPLL